MALLSLTIHKLAAVCLPDAKGNATVVDGTVIETASTAVVLKRRGETTVTFVTADMKSIQTVSSDDEVETTTTTMIGEHEIETGTETDIENAVEIVPTTKIVIVIGTGTVPRVTTGIGAKEITSAEVIEIERTVTDIGAVID